MGVHLRTRKLPSGRSAFFLEINHEGQQRFEALHLFLVGDKVRDRIVKKQAANRRDIRAAEILQKGIGPPKKSIRFSEFADSILRTKGRAMKDSARSALDRFRDHAGDPKLGAISPEMIEGFREHLLGLKEVSRNTAGAYIQRIRTLLNVAVKQKLIGSNPCAGISVKQEERLPTFLELEELKAFATAPTKFPNIKAGFLFSAFTGLRFSDTTALTWDQVSADGRTMTLRIQKTATPIRLPLSDEAQSILRGQRNAEPGNVHRHPSNSVFHLPAISMCNRVLKDIAKAAKIQRRITTHVARHSFATLLLANHVDVTVIQKLLVHGSLRSTLRYAHVLDTAKESAVKNLPRLTTEGE